MKKIKKTVFIVLAAVVLTTQSGCFGSFELTQSIYQVNKSVGDKVVQEVVFLAFCIIPVYEIGVIGDVLIFNTIEFWSGTNPLAMNEGETEIQFLQNEERLFQLTAMKNRFLIEVVEGEGAGTYLDLNYDPQTEIWAAHKDNKKIDMFKVLENNHAFIYQPFGMGKTIHLTSGNIVQMNKKGLWLN